MAFLHKYNTDDIFVRAVIVGFINLLNNKIEIEQVLSDDKTEIIQIPWFFDQSGEEDFIQDYFVNWADCVHPKLVDGNFDTIPRGVLKLGGIGISTGNLTNKFVRGTYTKEVNGVLETFTAFVRQIPMSISFDAEIKADTFNQSMKIIQSVIETFYSSDVFRTSYKGFMVSCQVGFPDSYDLDKMMEYTYGDGEDKIINLSFEVETYMPVVNKESIIHASKRITAFGGDINPKVTEFRGFKIIAPTDVGNSTTYFAGDRMLMEWKTFGNIRNVNISFDDVGNDEWKPIARSIPNRDFYEWNIREFNIKRPQVIFKNDQNVVIPAKIIPIVNATGALDNIVIVDPGLGYDNNTIVEILEGENYAKIQPQVVEGSIFGIDTSKDVYEKVGNFSPPQSKTIRLRISDAWDDNNYIITDSIFIT